jgi:PAS domain S-box-containing protein
LQATLSALPDILFEVDLKGKIYDFRSPNTELLYTSPDKFLNKYISEILPPNVNEIILDAIQQANIAGQHFGSTYSLKVPAGIKWFDLSISSKGQKDSPERRFIILARDITERKENEQALTESEEKYRRLSENAQDMIYRMSLPDGRYEYVSPASINIMGYNPEEIYHSPLLIAKIIHPDYNEYFKIEWEKLIKGDMSPTYEYKIITRTGNEKWLYQRNVLIKDKLNNPIAIEGIVTDITNRKKAIHDLKESESKLKEANDTKDKFFSIIAHDLRSPFNSMLGFAKMLEEKFDKYDTVKKKKFIGIINKGLQDSYKLLENLLYWSRSQSGKISIRPETINLFLLSNESGEFLNQSIKNKSIKLINKIPEDIYVDAYKEMLSTIIRNLISNAMKFTLKNGEIEINAILINDDHNKFVELTVKDTGIGISKEMQYKLFEISENTSTEGTEQETGTGLGLILCKEFVEKQGGKIWVESELGKGSAFSFTIPYKLQTKMQIY